MVRVRTNGITHIIKIVYQAEVNRTRVSIPN